MVVIRIKSPTDRKTGVVIREVRKVIEGSEEACIVEPDRVFNNVVYVVMYKGLDYPLGEAITSKLDELQVRYAVV